MRSNCDKWGVGERSKIETYLQRPRWRSRAAALWRRQQRRPSSSSSRSAVRSSRCFPLFRLISCRGSSASPLLKASWLLAVLWRKRSKSRYPFFIGALQFLAANMSSGRYLEAPIRKISSLIESARAEKNLNKDKLSKIQDFAWQKHGKKKQKQNQPREAEWNPHL